MPGSVLVTGGLGFIGYNAALRYAARGRSVVLFDDVSRGTAKRNLAEFQKAQPRGVRLVQGDVRNARSLERVLENGKFDLVLHMAAQVAVTTSVEQPRPDFEINALGTFNALEAARRKAPKALFVYASTNKVYGGTEWVKLGRAKTRYFFEHPEGGIAEDAPLYFHSPYGCSKGAGDQYVRDYARIYGLKTVVFRQSCVYGPWQYGEADQGWVAWFLIAALTKAPLTVYGDGKQVRDLLYVDDLLDLYDLAYERRDRVAGQVFNAGGGPQRTLSLVELIEWLERRLERRIRFARRGWRPGDQRVYVSDIGKAQRALRWRPRVSVGAGLEKLFGWLSPRLS
jgi:CDP-paratose 2-epimerase